MLSQHDDSPGRPSRRRFLGQTLRTAAAGGCLAASVSRRSLGSPVAGSPPWRMRLSTSSIHFKDLPVEEACARIGALGFEAVDIWSAHDGCPHLDDALKRLGPKGLREVLERNRLALYAFSTYRGGYARYAELLGGAGGGVAVQGSAPPCDPAELRTRMRAFLESLRPLADLAEKHDSYLAIENHGHALLDSLDSLRAFVELNRSPRIGIALAPYHVQAREESVEKAIEICGSQLLFFYAWQKQPDLRQLPGHGSTDFTPWIAALERIRYRWYVNPFLHGHQAPDTLSRALERSRDYLRECRAKVGGRTEPGSPPADAPPADG